MGKRVGGKGAHRYKQPLEYAFNAVRLSNNYAAKASYFCSI